MKVNAKKYVRRIIDLLMTVLLFLLMAYHYFGDELHEIMGTLMFVLFIIHHILNRFWFKGLKKGIYSKMRIWITAIDFLLLADMLALMVSGISMSRHIFDFLPIRFETAFVQSMHMVASYGGFLLMGLHIGIHLDRIIRAIPVKNRCVLWVLRGLALINAIYGITAVIRRDFLDYITLKSHFAFFDYEEPWILFFGDYAAITGMMVFVSYYIQKFLKYSKQR